jgi:histone H1/5
MVRAMSIEKPLREMVQKELQGRLSPLLKAIARMNERLDTLDEVKDLLYGLEPMAVRLMEREQAARTGVPREESPEEEQAEEAPVPPPRAARGGGAAASAAGRPCAVIGCRRPARSKGYCSAHYQKLRLLVKSGRRPASWVDDAAPRSVPEIVLPRGRAAVKAREEAPAPSRPEPRSPPKPKAWVRKKGGERISLT